MGSAHAEPGTRSLTQLVERLIAAVESNDYKTNDNRYEIRKLDIAVAAECLRSGIQLPAVEMEESYLTPFGQTRIPHWSGWDLNDNGERIGPLLFHYAATYNWLQAMRSLALAAAEPSTNQRTAAAPKRRNSSPGSADIRIVSTLSEHHKYESGSCQYWEPIGSNELARVAGVSGGKVSGFWKLKFRKAGCDGTYESYRRSCANSTLPLMLAAWRGETPAAEAVQLLADDIRQRGDN